MEDQVELVQDSNGLVRFDSSTITNKIIMKKKTITIGALLLAMNCFSQTDTLAYRIVGKEKYEFNYYNKELKDVVKFENYQDFKFKLKKNDFLFIDLFDFLDDSTISHRNVTIYYREDFPFFYSERLRFNSDNNTLWIDGSIIKKVIVHKPKLK